jgi:hypothetical protein
VAPVDGGAQRLLAGGCVARAGARCAERGIQAFGDLGRRQHSAPGGRKLDGQREPVHAPADVRDRGGVDVGQGEAGVVSARAFAEQRDGVRVGQRSRVVGLAGLGQRQRRYRVALFGLHSQRCTTGGQDGERGTGPEQSGDTWRGCEQLLEVVRYQQQVFGGQKAFGGLVGRLA